MEQELELLKEVNHLHDRGFRFAVTFPEVRQSLLEMVLPTNIKMLLNMTTIKSFKEIYLDETLNTSICDSTFCINYRGSNKFLLVFIEHQSSLDYKMAIRVEDYKNAIRKIIYRNRRKDDERPLPAIYPVILYHGERHYSAPTSIMDLIYDPAGIEKSDDISSPQLINLNKLEDNSLLRYGWAGILCFCFKHVRRSHHDESVLILLRHLDNLEGHNAKDFSDFMLKYFCAGIDMSAGQFRAIFSQHNCTQQLEGKVMTLAESFVQEGIEKGIEKGKIDCAQALLREGMEKEFIEKTIGIDLEKLL